MKAFAIILAAGRGSRMKELTAERPKCMIELGGHPLLCWQEKALKAAGIEDIHIVKGYKAELLPAHFSFSLNPIWAETNMLYSLSCASGYIEKAFEAGYKQFVISYSDIVYHSDHIRKLLAASEDIALTYDTLWRSLWDLRFENPLEDAETFYEEKGRLREIGGKTGDIGKICGQYMGLLKLTRAGWKQWNEEARKVDLGKMDMTSFLRSLLKNSIKITAVPVAGKWCEADSHTDLQAYEQELRSGTWSHDWRQEEHETR